MSKMCRYLYGSFLNKKNKKKYFLILESQKPPENILDIFNIYSTGKEAELALFNFINSQKSIITIPKVFTPGRVVILLDEGPKNHFGILISSISENRWFLLMFTSNVTWAKQVRKASQEEIALAGFVTTKNTYLALVVRPEYILEPLEQEFPEHRVDGFLREFKVGPYRD